MYQTNIEISLLVISYLNRKKLRPFSGVVKNIAVGHNNPCVFKTVGTCFKFDNIYPKSYLNWYRQLTEIRTTLLRIFVLYYAVKYKAFIFRPFSSFHLTETETVWHIYRQENIYLGTYYISKYKAEFKIVMQM